MGGRGAQSCISFNSNRKPAVGIEVSLSAFLSRCLPRHYTNLPFSAQVLSRRAHVQISCCRKWSECPQWFLSVETGYMYMTNTDLYRGCSPSTNNSPRVSKPFLHKMIKSSFTHVGYCTWLPLGTMMLVSAPTQCSWHIRKAHPAVTQVW